MIDLFLMGGPLFMGMITLILLAGAAVAVKSLMSILNGGDVESIRKTIDYVRSIGLLALVMGILGQMIGLFSAFQAIEEMGSVSPALLAGGLKVSAITTIYGMICFVLCYLFYFGLSLMISKK